MKHSLLLIILLTLATGYGCKSNSTSTPAGPTIVIPNVGSSWTLQNIHRDSTGTIKKTDTSTRVIAQTNMAYQGFSDVVMIAETNLSTKVSDTVYIRYLSDGDISRLSSPALGVQPPIWLIVPYTTHAAQTYNFSGTASAIGFTHDTVAFSDSYVQNDNDTVAGVIYPVSIITSTTWQSVTSATKDSTALNTQTNSFIPSKGIFGNRNATVNQINGKNLQRQQQTLISVSLK